MNGWEIFAKSMLPIILKQIGVTPQQVQEIVQTALPTILQSAELVATFDKKLNEIQAQQEKILALLETKGISEGNDFPHAPTLLGEVNDGYVNGHSIGD